MTSLRGARVLVTGGTGFIGSRLARRLVREDADVHLLVRRASKPDRLGPAWEKMRRHEGDLRDRSSLDACVRAAQPQVVFHLARERGAPLEVELGATLRLAEALRSASGGVRWVRTALASRKGYGASEEGFLRERLGARYGLATVSLELFKVYGPGQDLDMFPADLVRDALDGRGLRVTSQGLQDFIYVEDVVDAYLLAATRPGIEGATFQIGSGLVRTSEEAAAVVLRRLGTERTVEARSARGSLRSGEGQPADVEPARLSLGWIPNTSFEQGIDGLIAWHRSIAPDPVPGGGLGFDSERGKVRCWIGDTGLRGTPANRARAFVAGRPLTARWARPALKGRALSLLGEFRKARPLLDSALACDPCDSEALAWRGELRLLEGDCAGAREDLDSCLRLDGRSAWAFIYRSALHYRSGDAESAGRDLERFVALMPRSAVGYALQGILASQRGDLATALQWLDLALACRGSGWVRALRGSARAAQGDLQGAQTDLVRAARTERSPWVMARRADVRNRTGLHRLALRDLRTAGRMLPADPEPRLQAAAIHQDQAQYGQAAQALSQAMALRPGDPSLYQRRSRLSLVQGRLIGAMKDIEQALRLQPGDFALEEERLRLLVLAGRDAEAEAAVAASSWPPSTRAFWLGTMRCRQKRYREAGAFFDSAAGAADAAASQHASKARFFRGIARVLEAPAEPRADGPELLLVGLGYLTPYQVTIEALRLLAGCGLIFSNLSDREVADFLGLFPAPFHAVVFRQSDRQADPSARTVMAGFRRARRVALVTRGHPLFYGRLAFELVRRARRAGIRCRIPSSLSISDMAPGLAGSDLVNEGGMQVRDCGALGKTIDRRLPLILYNLPRGLRRRAFTRRLSLAYAPDHPCYLLAGAGESECRATSVAVSLLGPALEGADPACTLFLPPESREQPVVPVTVPRGGLRSRSC